MGNQTVYSYLCQWVIDNPQVNDDVRLAIIERELDNFDADGPYRSGRQRLNREKARILKRREGKDHRYNITGEKNKRGGLPKDQLYLLRMKKSVDNILNEIDPPSPHCMSPGWRRPPQRHDPIFYCPECNHKQNWRMEDQILNYIINKGKRVKCEKCKVNIETWLVDWEKRFNNYY